MDKDNTSHPEAVQHLVGKTIDGTLGNMGPRARLGEHKDKNIHRVDKGSDKKEHCKASGGMRDNK